MDKHHGRNRYRSSKVEPSENLEKAMRNNAEQEPFVFNKNQQNAVETSIKETCQIRNYELLAINVRTNHLHAVVSVKAKPEIIINGFKSHATRKLRESYLILKEDRIWSRGGSRRYLWKSKYVGMAIDYVLYGQGKLDFE